MEMLVIYIYITKNSSQASVATKTSHKKYKSSQMKTNYKPFHTSIFRLRTGVFIRVNYSCPAHVILFFTSLK